MAESSLSLTYNQIIDRVGRYLGYGKLTSQVTEAADGTLTTTAAFDDADEFVQSGYRQFIWPPPMDVDGRGPRVHEWTFLTPTTTIQVFPDFSASSTRLVSIGVDGADVVMASTTFTFLKEMIGSRITVIGGGLGSADGTCIIKSLRGNDPLQSGQIVVQNETLNPLFQLNQQFSLVADGVYPLPDDFAGIDNQLTFAPGTGFAPIPTTSENQIRQNKQFNSGPSRPRMAAVRPKRHSTEEQNQAAGQRQELLMWPVPDQQYQMSYRYSALPPKLSFTNSSISGNAYPIGGAAHAETILESCLAVAEREGNDEWGGPHWRNFLVRLRASIVQDMNSGSTPEHLGYNGDLSDSFGRRLTTRDYRDLFDSSTVTLQGAV